MFTFPKKFHNFSTTDEHVSFLNFMNSFNYNEFTDKGISIKVSFESKDYVRIILRKDSRKVDYQCSYGVIDFLNKIQIAEKLL